MKAHIAVLMLFFAVVVLGKSPHRSPIPVIPQERFIAPDQSTSPLPILDESLSLGNPNETNVKAKKGSFCRCTLEDPKVASNPLLQASASGNLKKLKRALASGASLNTVHKNSASSTLLDCAVENGQYKTVRYLIEQGANVNQANKYGVTPLHYAVNIDSLPMMELLLNGGANPRAEDKDGYTPLDSATTAKPEILEKLSGYFKKEDFVKRDQFGQRLLERSLGVVPKENLNVLFSLQRKLVNNTKSGLYNSVKK